MVNQLELWGFEVWCHAGRYNVTWLFWMNALRGHSPGTAVGSPLVERADKGSELNDIIWHYILSDSIGFSQVIMRGNGL